MKVLLMMPPMSIEKNYANLATVAANMPSLGMGYIYSAFEEAGCDVHFKDFQGQIISSKDILNYINKEQFDLVGMQAYISNINTCFQLASIIKQNCPKSRVILGGPHATIFPDMVINHPKIDFVAISEAELTVKELVEHLKSGKEPTNILGLYYRNSKGEIFKNPLRPLVDDMDSLPVPKYEIFNPDQYYPAVHIRGKKVYNLISSRGCPFKCTFCAATKAFGSTFRYQSVDRTIKEMKFLKEKLSVDSLQIYDDNFTTNKKRVKELCKRMIEENLGLQWNCYTRADAIGDEEMLQLMKKAGCYMIVVGIENGNPRILELLQKKLNLDAAKRNVQLARKVGINVLSSFMIGLPSETREEIENTIKYSTSIGMTYATYPIFTPYPGTPIYDDAKRLGTILGENFDEFSRWGDGVYESAGLTRSDYRSLQKKAFRKFFLRPNIIFNMFFEILKLPAKRRIRFIKGGLGFFMRKTDTHKNTR